MPQFPANRIDYLRAKAEELRSAAQHPTSPDAWQKMVSESLCYDALADAVAMTGRQSGGPGTMGRVQRLRTSSPRPSHIRNWLDLASFKSLK